MIKTRVEACKILGLRPGAQTDEIKKAYKELVKRYHPDVTGVDDTSVYTMVTEAYDFLMGEEDGTSRLIAGYATPENGRHSQPGRTYSRARSNADYAAFQKKIKRAEEKKKKDFEEKQKEFSKQIKKQEADYKRAMEAIDAIRAARTIEAMIWANGMEKDNGSNKEQKE
ncbi:MAG: J domain-containing protein [Pseudobutyrivibrio sp.]|nr:J domain-containing protein [Pseudobutyrivibrio sp.]